MKKPRLLVITPVKHINGVSDKLESFSDVCYIDDPSLDEILPLIDDFDAIFTNPNKSKIGKISRPYIMPEEISINIDEKIDFLIAELMLKKLKKNA